MQCTCLFNSNTLASLHYAQPLVWDTGLATSHIVILRACDLESLQHFDKTDQDFEGLGSINFVDYPAYLDWVELTQGMDSPASTAPTEQQEELRQTHRGSSRSNCTSSSTI